MDNNMLLETFIQMSEVSEKFWNLSVAKGKIEQQLYDY